MDIYIAHDGQESGPFSENAVRELLAQGGVKETDFAWRTGMEKWVPVSELLTEEKPAPIPGSTPPPPSENKFEPATPKQKALLSFLGVTFPADLSRDQAARRVNDAMEDSENAVRLKLWNEERLRLHPELFAAEIQAKKENRANHFLELCQTAGARYFSGISKAHCQVLVGFLDVKFPNWDANEAEAAENYFFPAVAEKFPQLVNKQWRGRLRYADGMKVSREIVNHSPVSVARQTATSPLVATVRGVVLGLIILAVLYLGYRTTHREATAAPVTSSTDVSGTTSEPATPAVAPISQATPSPAEAVVTAATTPEKLPTIDPLPPVTPPEPAPTPVATLPATPLVPDPPTPPTAVVPLPPPAVALVPDASMTPPAPGIPATPATPNGIAPLPGVPSIPGLPPSPPADPASPVAALPPSPPPPVALPGTPTPADPTMPLPAVPTGTPMAPLPGAEPPVPVPPPPVTLPVAGMLPSSPTPATPPADAAVPGLPPSPPAVPAVPGLPPSPSTDTPTGLPAAKTILVLTKVVEAQLTYGKITLRPGTQVKLISRQGSTLKVSYGNNVITIPVTSTDLE